MDEWLDDIGLYRKNIALDGSCLFRAVADLFLPANPIGGHLVIRRAVVKYLKENPDYCAQRILGDVDEYLEALSTAKGWGGPLELDVISRLFKVEFYVFRGPSEPIQVTNNGHKEQVLLCVSNNSFYEIVYKKSHIENLGFCQSIVYKVLYEDVYQLSHIDFAVYTMLHDKAARAQRERFLQDQGIRDDVELELEEAGADVNVRKVLGSGAILFPYKVAKALDPDIYRNINFDVWVDLTRVGRRSTFWHGNGGPLRVGGRCQVRYDGHILTGHIQEMSPDRGPAVVYIEELAIKRTVPFDDLIPIPRSFLRPEMTFKHQMMWRNAPPPPLSKAGNQEKKLKSDLQNIQVDSSASSVSPMPKPSHALIHTPTRDEFMLTDKLATISIKNDFSDLPLHDLPTLQFFYNMGIEYFHQGSYYTVPTTDSEKPYPCDVYMGADFIKAPPSILYEAVPPGIPIPVVNPLITSMAASVPPMAAPMTPMAAPITSLTPVVSPVPSPMSVPPPPLSLVGLPPTPPDAAFVEPSPQMPDTPHIPREEKTKRGRHDKFVKPPRFQRLESQKQAAGKRTKVWQQDEGVESVPEPPEQVNQVSSTTPPDTAEPYELPVAVIHPNNYLAHDMPCYCCEQADILYESSVMYTPPYNGYSHDANSYMGHGYVDQPALFENGTLTEPPAPRMLGYEGTLIDGTMHYSPLASSDGPIYYNN